jgi:radical SAM superfamily enzyme YgiQ (UPF0313 family)
MIPNDDRIALILCPCWDVEFPPYGISLLSGILSNKGFPNRIYDFNKIFYRLSSNDKPLWDQVDLYGFWMNDQKIEKVFVDYADVIELFLQKLSKFEVIGFSVFTLNIKFTLRFAQMVRERYPEKFLVAGGPECSPNFSVDNIMSFGVFDAVCKSDAEDCFPILIEEKLSGKPISGRGFFLLNESGTYDDSGDYRTVTKLHDLAFANFDYLGKNASTLNISTSRGCVRDCSYCPERSIWGSYNWRKAESTVSELLLMREKYPALDFVYFNDDLVNGHMRELEKMCDLLIENKWNTGWGGHALVRDRWTDSLVEKIAMTRGQRFNFGIESGSNRILKLMKKMFEVEQAYDLFEKLNRHKVSFSINLIIGFPGETEEDFDETRKLAQIVRKYTNCIHVNPCIVLKGTDLYDNKDKWGIELTDNFVTEWRTVDGKNTNEMRMKRARQLISEIS